jgi:hypothetical protein
VVGAGTIGMSRAAERDRFLVDLLEAQKSGGRGA